MTDLWNEIFEDPKSPVEEAFDHTWPYTFKWAFDTQTGKVEAWKVNAGGDGRPSHRAEVTERWGRPPRVTEGDVLGTATYIPAEKKLDGTVVAPADLQIHPYYNQSIPAQVRQWFEDQFPDAIVRQATAVATLLRKRKAAVEDGWHAEDGWKDSDFELPDPDDVDDTPVYKWVWNREDGLIIWETSNEDGLPTHNQKTNAEWDRDVATGAHGDKLGFATIDYPEDGTITIDSYSEHIPPGAFAAVKEQLAEWFPHHQIASDDGPPGEKHEFNSDPADYKSAAIAWANEHLGSPSEAFVSPVEATPAKTGLLGRIFPKRKNQKLAEAALDGAMVALFIPEETGKKLQIKGGEPTVSEYSPCCFEHKGSGQPEAEDLPKKSP